MEAQRPENNAVIELPLKGIHRIFEEDIPTVDVVRDVFLKQSGKVLLERVNDFVDSCLFNHPSRLCLDLAPSNLGIVALLGASSQDRHDSAVHVQVRGCFIAVEV